MTTFVITAPDGKKYKVTGDTPEGAHSALMKMLGDHGAAPAATGAEAPQYAPNGVPMNAAAKAEIVAKAKAGTLAANPASTAGSDAMTAKAEAAVAPSWMDSIGDVATAGTMGAARGAAALPGTPGSMYDLQGSAIKKVGGWLGLDPDALDKSAAMVRGMSPGGSLPSSSDLVRGLSDLTGGWTDYKGKSKVAQYASAVGEFLPGAAIFGGLNPASLIRGAVIPGVASEAAGQATEGTALEPYARFGAGMLASLLAAKPGSFAGSADDEAARMANVATEGGIKGITKGQASGSEMLMRMEGRLSPTGGQLDDFTTSVMGRFGTGAKAATPTKLVEIEGKLVSQMDDAVKGVDIVPTASNASTARSVAADYAGRAPMVSLTPRIKGIASEIADLAKSGKTVALDQLKTWRSDIGSLAVSADDATREAAHGLRTLIDDMTDTALNAAGRADDIASLDAARLAYRDFIAVRDASTRAGSRAGSLSPQELNQAMIRSQGRTSYAMGRGTPLTDFVRSAATTLRAAPTVAAGGVRSVQGAVPAALAALGVGGALSGGLGPLAVIGTGAISAGLPAAGKALMRSNPVQALLRNPWNAMGQTVKSIPGALAQ